MNTRTLSQAEIEELHRSVVELQLDRDTLLSGVSRTFVAGIGTANSYAAQLLRDLHAMNTVDLLADNSHPLTEWLNNAKLLASQRGEAIIFRRYLLRLRKADDAAIPTPRVTPTRLPSQHSNVLNGFTPFRELRIVATALSQEISNSSDLRRDLSLRFTTEPGVSMKPREFLEWSNTQAQTLDRTFDLCCVLIDQGIAARLAASTDVPADEDMRYVARRMGELYRDLIRSAIRWRNVRIERVFADLVRFARNRLDNFITTLEEWGPRLLRDLDAHVLAASNTTEPPRIVLKFDVPGDDAEGYCGEFLRLSCFRSPEYAADAIASVAVLLASPRILLNSEPIAKVEHVLAPIEAFLEDWGETDEPADTTGVEGMFLAAEQLYRVCRIWAPAAPTREAPAEVRAAARALIAALGVSEPPVGWDLYEGGDVT